MPPFLLSLEQRLQAQKEYLDGETITNLSKKYGVHADTMYKNLVKLGTEIRSIGENNRRYPLDDNAFGTITPESAYWIGFLMADGNAFWRGPDCAQITITLHNRDYEHLVKFQTFLNTEMPIRIVKEKYCTLVVKSAQIARDLEKYGVVPRKSHTAEVKFLENNRDFWRGVIDGDGTVCITKEGKILIGACGSFQLMSQLRQFLLSIIPDFLGKVRKKSSIFDVCVSRCRAIKVMSALYYKDCLVALDRKEAKANLFINSSNCA